MRRVICCLFLFSLMIYETAFAIEIQDRESIHKIIDHFTTAWNQHEGRGSAHYYAEDADFVNIFGMAFSGKKEIEIRHIKIHETFLKGTFFEVTDVRLREVQPSLVIGLVYWTVSGIQRPGASTKETMKGVFTHAFIRDSDHWKITSTQNTMIKE